MKSVLDFLRSAEMQNADETLTLSIKRLHQAAESGNREVANDIQNTVIFATFAASCRFRTNPGCSHEKHEAAATGAATCNEEQCPFMRGR